MPEGPSIVLLKEETVQFTGEEILAVEGNTSIDKERLLHQKVLAFKSWGKHFLICFEGFTLRVHFLLFGSYRINEPKPDRPVRLHLKFRNGEINLYTCSLRFLEGDVNSHYDWSVDVMNDSWNSANARKKLKSRPDAMICDALLEQDVFAGVGNIIKNEILYRVQVHPESRVGSIPPAKLNRLVGETRIYSFEFLNWKRNYELRKHWLSHNQKTCTRCNLSFVRKQTGLKKRRSFICDNCMKLYADVPVKKKKKLKT